ncbi:CobW family GTP-binding protein [Alteromonas sp. a30]|uniref:CobW family GTP-binding protein n=1 Tax=Alteromonas sp. a30 TaxID=2730917 RepID=UPI00227FE1EC|nr:GTP-binding protein [Alteromonas sp. a30]MCY7295589.1 GTP-binding protein [Alteromonas sp. a30]
MKQSQTTSPINSIKTNMITGFLGVGKTTAIQHLLQHKPTNERWAILVNEFGEVGIDGAIHKGSTGRDNASEAQIFVKEVPGGCMCCTSGLPMQIALNQLIAKAKPDRLIIEPTGIGHPKEMLKSLNEPHYHDLIDLRATLTLVDARKVSIERYATHPTFQDQLSAADHIIAAKADQYQAHHLPELHAYLRSLNLADTPVSVVEHGQLQADWLEPKHQKTSSSISPQATNKTLNLRALSKQSPSPFKVGSLFTASDFTNNAEQTFYSNGWTFPPNNVFNFYKIMDILNHVDAERIKAVFITERGIFGFNKADAVLSCMELDESDDSRIEYITQSKAEAKQLSDILTPALAQAQIAE